MASLVAGLSLALILALGLMLSTSATTPEMPTTKTTTPGRRKQIILASDEYIQFQA